MLYCDDYLGVCDSEEDLQACWSIWKSWSVVSGCGLGVVGTTKTCFVAAEWQGRKLVDAELAEPLCAIPPQGDE